MLKNREAGLAGCIDLLKCEGECGCAAKIAPDRLRDILSDLNLPTNENVLIGPETLDDAGIYRISDDRYLVQTVDYFPPVARDPFVYGQIAAANSLSDVYAMGGTPLTALAITCFPADKLPLDALKDITRGAVDKLREAGAVLLGGHSIVDAQPKYGLAVTGEVSSGELMDNAHAKPGDVLILTKPLGTGITIMAAKGGVATNEQENEANRSMATLNSEAAQVATANRIKACTDVTGFGLLGHGMQMARASGVSFRMRVDAMAKLDGVLEFAEMGLLSAAAYSNRSYVGDAATFGRDVALAEQDMLFDPQTSGGLLMSCPEDRAEAVINELQSRVSTPCRIIGDVTEAGSARIVVTKD